MNYEELEELIKEFFEEEYEVLGRSVTKSIIKNTLENKKTKIESFNYGSNIDFALIISTVTVVVSAIDLLLKIIERREKSNKKANEDILLYLHANLNLSISETEILKDERVVTALKAIIKKNQENEKTKKI
ncbi:MAG: hypothetical protein H6557_34205 [Lewinellaceae bacterium]|nr:hypothetical protein [Lewinellaceae bacterium]